MIESVHFIIGYFATFFILKDIFERRYGRIPEDVGFFLFSVVWFILFAYLILTEPV